MQTARCLLWDSYTITRQNLNLISLGIGIFSSCGYITFMLVVASFPDRCNVSFRNGFMTSGVVNLVIMQLSGFSTSR